MKDILETFENPQKKDDYLIKMDIPEFTCICPLTSQPDFAEFYLEYVPDKFCVELKSLNYTWVRIGISGLFTKTSLTRSLITFLRS